MGALDVVLGLLGSQPWKVRCRFTTLRQGRLVTITQGGRHVDVRELGADRVEVLYEHTLHETTREYLGPEAAARLILALVQRDRLCRVEVPHA